MFSRCEQTQFTLLLLYCYCLFMYFFLKGGASKWDVLSLERKSHGQLLAKLHLQLPAFP